MGDGGAADEVVRERESVAERYPRYASQITAGARQAFLDGDKWAYSARLAEVLLGAVLVWLCFPKKAQEAELLVRYHAEDAERAEREGVAHAPAVLR